MLPKMGNEVPKRSRGGPPKLSYAEAVAAALHEELGGSHRALKVVMRWTGVSERTAKYWFAGTKGPSGEHLVSLVRHSDAVLVRVLELAAREVSLVAVNLADARARLAAIVGSIDELLASTPKRTV